MKMTTIVERLDLALSKPDRIVAAIEMRTHGHPADLERFE
jgi:hypothetical protein